MLRAVIVTNIPTPYRIPVYEILDAASDVDLSVVYLAEREPNRSWNLDHTSVRSVTLRPTILRVGKRYIHFTRGVWSALRRLRPDVVVTTGFNPPHLAAFLWCWLHRVPHVVQTDGTPRSEAELTFVHRATRQVVGHSSAAGVAASDTGMALVRSWGVPADATRKSPLAIDNDAFGEAAEAVEARDVDVLFSGQLTSVKDPLFALRATAAAARTLGRRLSIVVIGDGPLRAAVDEEAARLVDLLDVQVAGFQQQADLPRWYARSKLFLFPTHWEPWGLVLNEALAAGAVPVVSPFAGSGEELLAGGTGGVIVALDTTAWAAQIARLLSDDVQLAEMSAAARASVSEHTWSAAARGIREALLEAARRP